VSTPEENPVRAFHDAVAHSGDDAEASTRPPETTDAELRRMVADVLAKLSVTGQTSVVEIGCGTGVLAVPVARVARRFVGVDFSSPALATLRRKLTQAGLLGKTELVELDVLRAPDRDVQALGTFDRVLVYAALHYVADDDELARFIERAVSLAAPSGAVLFGSLPVDDAPVRRRRVAGIAYRAWRKSARALNRRPSRPSPELPSGTTVELTAAKLQGWFDARPDLESEWLAPRLGTPMFARRADLLVRRRAS
jgi:SAM-dependent methyltransferase